MRAHFVGERRLRDHLETEVVTELFARLADDFQPQSQAIGIGLGIAQPNQFGESRRRDRDDGGWCIGRGEGR